MPEAVAAATPAPAAANTTQTNAPKPQAGALTKPPEGGAQSAAAAQQAADEFELVIAGQKEKRSWNDPETRKAAIEALQKRGYAERTISDSRNAYKAVTEREKALNTAVAQAQQGDPSHLFKLLGVTPDGIQKDPARQAAIMKMLGVDPEAHARTLLSQKLDMANMTPEQRRIAELENKVAEAERTTKALSEQRRQERIQARARQAQAALMKDLTAAAERVGLAADERSLYAIYEVMNEFHAAEVPMAPDLIVEEAKARIDGGFKRLEEMTLKGLDGPALAQRLGPEVMKRIRQHLITDKDFIKEMRLALVAKVRSGQPLDAAGQKQQQPPPQSSSGPSAPTQYKTMAQLEEEIRALAKGGTR